MGPVRVLVAEDEVPIRELIEHHLHREGYAVVSAADGSHALRLARAGVDLIVLDLGLPGVDGLEVTRALRREQRTTPIVMLTARAEEIDRIVGFEVGADDYLVKPFSPRELIARIRAIVRRTNGAQQAAPQVLEFGRLVIDEAAREARVDGEDLHLKPREFALLLALASHPGIALRRDVLLERVWGYDFAGDERTVDVHVRRVRKKVEERMGLGRCVVTVHGFGYKFVQR